MEFLDFFLPALNLSLVTALLARACIVRTVCGDGLWKLSVETVCGDYLWRQSVETHLILFSEQVILLGGKLFFHLFMN